MLTLDDLDHFNEQRMAHLFTPPSQRDMDSAARRSRILACLKACHNIPDQELIEGGLHTARRALKSVLRSQQRRRRIEVDELEATLDDARIALGEPFERPGEPADAAAERYAVEAEIQAAAVKLSDMETCDAELLDTLADGEFELWPSSDLAALSQASGKFGNAAKITVDLDLAVDSKTPAQLVRVHLVIETGFWRWVAQEGCCMSRNGAPAVFLPPGDGVVHALLGGLALRGGRTIADWAEAVGDGRQADDNASA
ncbi:MAG: hypothetical protein WAZ34_16925 [Rhodocyclaceae bacterium]